MRIRYVGAEASTQTFGRTFHQWEWVGVSDMDALALETLPNNPQFEVDSGDAEPESLEPLDGEPV